MASEDTAHLEYYLWQMKILRIAFQSLDLMVYLENISLLR